MYLQHLYNVLCYKFEKDIITILFCLPAEKNGTDPIQKSHDRREELVLFSLVQVEDGEGVCDGHFGSIFSIRNNKTSSGNTDLPV